jgi:hypothetical protein
MFISKSLVNMITFALFMVLTIMSKNAVAFDWGDKVKCINNGDCVDPEVCVFGECKDLATTCLPVTCGVGLHCVAFFGKDELVGIHLITCSPWHR